MSKNMPAYTGYYYDPDIDVYIPEVAGFPAATPKWMTANRKELLEET